MNCNYIDYFFSQQGDHTTDGMDLVPQTWVSFSL